MWADVTTQVRLFLMLSIASHQDYTRSQANVYTQLDTGALSFSCELFWLRNLQINYNNITGDMNCL